MRENGNGKDGEGRGRRTKSEFLSKCPDRRRQSCAYPRRCAPFQFQLDTGTGDYCSMGDGECLHRNAEQSMPGDAMGNEIEDN